MKGVFFVMKKRQQETPMDKIINKLDWRLRIVAKLFPKEFEKMYHLIRITIINEII